MRRCRSATGYRCACDTAQVHCCSRQGQIATCLQRGHKVARLREVRVAPAKGVRGGGVAAQPVGQPATQAGHAAPQTSLSSRGGAAFPRRPASSARGSPPIHTHSTPLQLHRGRQSGSSVHCVHPCSPRAAAASSQLVIPALNVNNRSASANNKPKRRRGALAEVRQTSEDGTPPAATKSGEPALRGGLARASPRRPPHRRHLPTPDSPLSVAAPVAEASMASP